LDEARRHRQVQMHIWQVMVWCGAGSRERSPEHLLAVLAEEGALIEVVLHEAFQRIQQEIGSELDPASVHAEVINAVIKEHWTLDQGVLHVRMPSAR
jgi:hypothetical protein